ncbi:MAG: PAS domain-containing protein [Actinomycetota bacterium]|nr:PAS domain-containing protein [Actinomycetota bacterium]
MADDILEPPVPYQALVEHLPVVVYIASDDPPVSRTLYISPNAEQIFGYAPEVLLSLGGEWTGLLHPDDIPGIRERYTESLRKGLPFKMEYRCIHPDGRVIPVRDHAVPFVNPTTGMRVWQGVIEDISDRVAAEQRGEASEIRYEILLQNLPAVVYEMVPDDDRRTRYVNRKIEELLGYTMEEWLEQPDMWMEVLHPDDREVELAAHDLHSATGDPWQREYRLIDSSGAIVWVRDQATLVRDADGNPFQWQGVMVDITVEKDAQRALERANDELEFRVRARTAQLEQANEAMGLEIAERVRAEHERDRASGHLGQILENVPAVVYLWQTREREDGQWFSYVGDQIAPMLGFSPAEWNESGWRARVHPHDRERVDEAATRSIDHGEPFQLEYRYLARDGRVVWVLDRATLVERNDIGEPLLFEGVMVDITAQREAESAAETATDRLRELVEHGPAILYGYSVVGDPPTANTDYVSPQFAELLGVPASALADDPRRWFDMVHPDDRVTTIDRSKRAWATGMSWDNEYRMLHANGEIVWVWDRGRCVRHTDDGRPHRFVGSVVDITARRTAADELSRRLEAVDALEHGAPVVFWTEVSNTATGSARYTYISAGSLEMMGYTPEELLVERHHFPRLVHPDDQDRVEALEQVAERTGSWDATYRIVHRDGGIRWIRSIGRKGNDPGPEPEEAVWHGVALDVTAQMEATGEAGVAPVAEVAPPISRAPI